MRTSRGFTLVELAIVMVIIGLLIGGILKGQSMIEGAKIKALISQVKGYQAATNTFIDKYNALPGDIAVARTRIPGCSAANFCFNGNGDRRIGTPTTNYSGDYQGGTNALPAVETTMFWKELALADLITGVETSANPTLPAFGTVYPACKGCGGFHVAFVNETGTTEPAVGHYLILRGSPSGSISINNPGQGAISPNWAREIETKMDDGNSKTGLIRSDGAAGNCANLTTGIYTTPSSDLRCMTIFKLE